MTDELTRREVMRADDPFGIPACFYWTVDDVVNWVESVGYAKYKETFRTHSINGRKLLTVDSCFLAKMGITDFGDILDLKIRVTKLVLRRLDYQQYVLPTTCRVDLPRTLHNQTYRQESVVSSRLLSEASGMKNTRIKLPGQAGGKTGKTWRPPRKATVFPGIGKKNILST